MRKGKKILVTLMLVAFTALSGPVLAESSAWTSKDQGEFDKILAEITKADMAIWPKFRCGNGYLTPEQRQYELDAGNNLIRVAKESETKLKAMGPKVIPHLVEALNHPSPQVPLSSIKVLDTFPVQSINEIENAVKDGRISDFQLPSGNYAPASSVYKDIGLDALPAMRRMIASEDVNCRLFAVKTLISMQPSYFKNRKVVEMQKPVSYTDGDFRLIETLFNDSCEKVRAATAKLMGQLALKHPAFIPILLNGLEQDKSSQVRCMCAEGIHEFITDQKNEDLENTVRVLKRARQTDHSQKVCRYIDNTLSALRHRKLPADLGEKIVSNDKKSSPKKLINLQASDTTLKSQVHATLADFNNVNAILKEILDADEEYRNSHEARSTETTEARTKSFLKTAKYQKFVRHCEARLRAIGPGAIEPLIAGLNAPNAQVHASCLTVLEFYKDETFPAVAHSIKSGLFFSTYGAIPYLFIGLGNMSNPVFEDVLSQRNPRIKLCALQILSRCLPKKGDPSSTGREFEASPQVVSLVMDAANDQNERVKKAAADVLGQIEVIDPGVNRKLFSLLQNGLDPKTREAGARSLGDLGTKINASEKEEVTRALAMSLMRDPDPSVRKHAALALGDLKSNSPELIQALNAGMADPAEDVRLCSIAAIDHLDKADGADVGGFIRALKERGQNYKAALQVVAKLGNNAIPAVPYISEYLGSEDFQTRRSALWALTKIGPGAASATDSIRIMIERHPELQGDGERALARINQSARPASRRH